MRDIGKVRKDSEHTAGWVSGRGNKRGSKSWPSPGVANERAPAGIQRGVRASYDVTRSVTSPPLPPTINDATLSSPSRVPSSTGSPAVVPLPPPPPSSPPLPPATHRAEPTGPSTQRGGGCFCNLATLSIFSIHTTLYSRCFTNTSFSLTICHPSCMVDPGFSLPSSLLSSPSLLFSLRSSRGSRHPSRSVI